MKIHFIGIGGISMSGLAHVCINLGYEVSGSDKSMSPILQKLINEGATIYIGHDESQLNEDIDLVVYNVYCVFKKRRPLCHRGAFLLRLTNL